MDDFGAILETGGAAAVEIAATSLAERGARVPPCPNCGKPMIGAYCAVCGQERDTHRRSVWGLVKVLIEDIASFDSRIMRTGWALLARPGELARAFREGRTQRYLPALRLYLFTSLIFFLILGATNIALMQFIVVATPQKVTWIKGEPYIPNPAYDTEDPDTHFLPKTVKISKEKATQPGGPFTFSSKIYFFSRIGAYHTTLSPEARKRLSRMNFDDEIDSDSKATPAQKAKAKSELNGWLTRHIFGGLQRLAADPAALNGPMTTWIPRVLFLLMPLYALLLALFYIRQRRDFFFVDHLIFSLTIHTFGFVLLLAAAGAAQIFSGETVAWGALMVGGIYALIATRNFYRQNWFWTAVKFASVSFFYVCFCVLPALGIVIALSFLDV
ncbi:MAG TPA: DUF3667 domain-containing protein [Rhizomicrobium sp.]|jgi:hypothetical protein|nr:DUF3667 domain-containing protein [Rhizomicrobium sp.]